MIELPLDELLAIAERDLRKNQAAFAETARRIDPTADAAAGARHGRSRLIRPPRSCWRRRRASSTRWAGS